MDKQENQLFDSYRLSPDIIKSLGLLGYQEPTMIQQAVIPAMLKGNNVVAKAPTGSGKTAAFAIPLCEAACWEENAPQALVLEPTRELADQVRAEVFHIGRMKRLKVPALFGGFPIDKQIQTLRQKSHIVIGTPGRVMDHLGRGSLKLQKITDLVIDEADLMLDMGFFDEVKAILAHVPEMCRISLFSATLKPEVRELAEDYIRESVLIMQEPQEQEKSAISEKVYAAEAEAKYKIFINILIKENPESCIIFCGTREMVNVLFQKMRRNKISCGMLHGEMEQKERLKTVEGFRRGSFRFLIATDVAARGIDFEKITHVINYDFPTGRETYVHRIGRTGRNGRTGTAISIIGDNDRRMLKLVEAYTGRTLPLSEAPQRKGLAEQEFWTRQQNQAERKLQKGDVLNQGITRLAIGGGRKSKIRAGDIVGTLCNIEGIEMADIGIIDIRDSITYAEVLNQKGGHVLAVLQTKPIKGKVRKVRKIRLPGAGRT